MRLAYSILVGKPEVKRPVGKPRRRWNDTIEIDLKGTRRELVEWINLALDRVQCRALANTIMNLAVPQEEGNFLTR
jgi:hypothetical protein